MLEVALLRVGSRDARFSITPERASLKNRKPCQSAIKADVYLLLLSAISLSVVVRQPSTRQGCFRGVIVVAWQRLVTLTAAFSRVGH